jgi:hypothetical protein
MPTYKMEASLELIHSISSYSILPVTTTVQQWHDRDRMTVTDTMTANWHTCDLT